MPEISIIIPVYNVEPYLRQCLDSVLTQTFADFEAILVDDGSTDGSGKICGVYAQLDARFRVVHQENAGLSGARNTGIKNASGSYLYFLDSDDWVESNIIETLYGALTRSGSQYAVCGYYIEAGSGKHFCPREGSGSDGCLDNMLRYARKEFSYAVWNKMYRRDIVAGNGILFYEGERFVEDQAFNLKYLLFCDKTTVVAAPMYHYRIRAGQITSESQKERLPTYIEDTKRLIGDFRSYGKYEEYRAVLAVHFAVRFNEFLGGCVKSISRQEIALLVKEIKKLYRETDISKNLKTAPFSKKERLFLILLDTGSAGTLFASYRFRQKVRALVLHSSFWPKRQYLLYTLKENNSQFLLGQSRGHGTKPRLYLIGTPEYNNIGDHAIAEAEKQYLKREFPDSLMLEVTENEAVLYFRELKKSIHPADIILLQGGGNMGGEYPEQEMIRKRIIKAFPRNRIVVFPQTIYLPDKPFKHLRLWLMRRYYSAHGNMLLCAREKLSYEMMTREFTMCRVALMPDIAFQLQSPSEAAERRGVLLCLRSDKEGVLSREDRAEISAVCRSRFKQVSELDTCLNSRVEKKDREAALNQFLMRFKSAELVVTDRLHGMILSALTETPCVVFRNSNHKIAKSFEWLADLGFVRLCDDTGKLSEAISSVMSCPVKYDSEAFNEYFDAIGAFIRENLENLNG